MCAMSSRQLIHWPRRETTYTASSLIKTETDSAKRLIKTNICEELLYKKLRANSGMKLNKL